LVRLFKVFFVKVDGFLDLLRAAEDRVLPSSLAVPFAAAA